MPGMVIFLKLEIMVSRHLIPRAFAFLLNLFPRKFLFDISRIITVEWPMIVNNLKYFVETHVLSNPMLDLF